MIPPALRFLLVASVALGALALSDLAQPPRLLAQSQDSPR